MKTDIGGSKGAPAVRTLIGPLMTPAGPADVILHRRNSPSTHSDANRRASSDRQLR